MKSRSRRPRPKTDVWFVYIARCADDTLYTGIARDVATRIAAHDAGRGARYTRGRGPLRVCAVRRCASKGDALRLELAIKRLPRVEKEALTRGRRLAALHAAQSETSAKPSKPQPESTRRLRRPEPCDIT